MILPQQSELASRAVGTSTSWERWPTTAPVGSGMPHRTIAGSRRTPMGHSARHQRILFSVVRTLMLFCVMASGAGAQNRNAASTSFDRGIMQLPILDKQDIRFT